MISCSWIQSIYPWEERLDEKLENYIDKRCKNNLFFINIESQPAVFTLDDGLPETVFSEIRLDESMNIIVVSAQGEFIFDGDRWKIYSMSSSILTEEKKKSDENVLSEVKYQHQVYIGKKDGLFIKGKQKNEWIEIFPSDRNYSWKLSNVNVLQTDSKDRMWFGSNEGAGYFHNGQWKLFTGKEGLPFKYITCIADAPDGEIWFGTRKGAIRTDGTKFYYRFSRRWLPDDQVNDILVEEDGTTRLATNKGMSRITFQSMTLEDVVPWDNNLCLMSMYGLLNYEKYPDNTFEQADEHLQKTGWHVGGKALPIDERCHVRLDRDGFALDATEGSGYSEMEGTIYLLPYYMARYHGLIK